MNIDGVKKTLGKPAVVGLVKLFEHKKDELLITIPKARSGKLVRRETWPLANFKTMTLNIFQCQWSIFTGTGLGSCSRF